jgi:lysophospholipase L1-like esterase
MGTSIYGVLLCIGDSLISGSRDAFGLSMPRELGRLLSKTHGQSWIAVEKGVNGETSPQLLRRFYDVCRAYPEASEIVVCIGANDAKQEVATPPNIFKANYRELIRTAKILNKPILMCLLPIPSGFGAPDHVDIDLIKAYNKIIFDLAHEGGPKGHHLVWYVESNEVPEGMQCDGIHLTHEGNIWFAEKVMAIIERERSY